MTTLAAPSVKNCRSRFPIFERLTYVNSCSQGALSDAVRGAYDDYLTGWDERGAPWEYWVERTETARATFARLVGGEADDVAVTTSLSAGVSPLASAIDFSQRPKVVISDFEFPTIGQICHAQELRGAQVVHVPADGAEIPLERFDEAIDEETALVSIAAVCYRNGSRLPAEEIARIAHARGALVVLDAYQAIGTYPLDVRELGVDVLAAGVLQERSRFFDPIDEAEHGVRVLLLHLQPRRVQGDIVRQHGADMRLGIAVHRGDHHPESQARAVAEHRRIGIACFEHALR